MLTFIIQIKLEKKKHTTQHKQSIQNNTEKKKIKNIVSELRHADKTIRESIWWRSHFFFFLFRNFKTSLRYHDTALDVYTLRLCTVTILRNNYFHGTCSKIHFWLAWSAHPLSTILDSPSGMSRHRSVCAWIKLID